MGRSSSTGYPFLVARLDAAQYTYHREVPAALARLVVGDELLPRSGRTRVLVGQLSSSGLIASALTFATTMSRPPTSAAAVPTQSFQRLRIVDVDPMPEDPRALARDLGLRGRHLVLVARAEGYGGSLGGQGLHDGAPDSIGAA